MSNETEGLKIEWCGTPRGFAIGRFDDLYQQACSIQASSLATEDAIWFGVVDNMDIDGDIKRHGSTYKHVNARMHLNRQQVADLLPILQQFVKTGELGIPQGTGT